MDYKKLSRVTDAIKVKDSTESGDIRAITEALLPEAPDVKVSVDEYNNGYEAVFSVEGIDNKAQANSMRDKISRSTQSLESSGFTVTDYDVDNGFAFVSIERI